MMEDLRLLFRKSLCNVSYYNFEPVFDCRRFCSCSYFFWKYSRYFPQIFDHGNLDILLSSVVQIITEVVMNFPSRYGDSRSINLGQFLDSLSIHRSIIVVDL